MSLLPMNPVPSSLFSWHKKSGVFSTEHSTFHGNGHQLSRIYDDAMDIGFAMQSKKTGAVKRFYLAGSEKDDEGDIQTYIFKPTDNDLSGIEVWMWNT